MWKKEGEKGGRTQEGGIDREERGRKRKDSGGIEWWKRKRVREHGMRVEKGGKERRRKGGKAKGRKGVRKRVREGRKACDEGGRRREGREGRRKEKQKAVGEKERVGRQTGYSVMVYSFAGYCCP